MSTRLTVSLYVLVFLLFVYLIHKIRSRKADIKYILPWLMLDLLLLLAVAFPNLIKGICILLGIQTPSNMVFFFGIIFLLFIVFSLTLTVSRLNNEIKELTQRIALNEANNGDREKSDSETPEVIREGFKR